MTHDFHSDLQRSMLPSGDRRTEEILREFFGSPRDFALDWSPRRRPYGHDCEARAWGSYYTIEEKRRTVDYGDVLLENVSNNRTGTPGWTRKCGNVDYVLFIFPGKRWEIFPGAALKVAFLSNVDEWLKKFGVTEARNKTYSTLNIAIPTSDLIESLELCGAAMCWHCKRNVGRFHMECSECSRLSCCAIGDEWVCQECCGEADPP